MSSSEGIEGAKGAGNIDPRDQLQIGDYVLYEREGVFARVVGYVWMRAYSALPRVVSYNLDCGVSVPREFLRRCPPGQRDRIMCGRED